MDYEQIGTTAVINAVSKTDRLKAFVNSNDKEPSFDGAIYIYDNKIYKKDNLKRVAIQVKGKGVKAKPKSSINYPISITDLENFMRNGGVLFFVVYIDKDSGDTKQIYYTSLLPIRIKEILKLNTDDKKSINIKFKSLPKRKEDLVEIFLNFYSQAQKQISFVDKDIPTIDELKDKGVLESLTFSFISADGNNEISNVPKKLNGKDLYLYANVKDNVLPVPIQCYADVDEIQMSCKNDVVISVKGTKYYDGILKTITEEEIYYQMGQSTSLIIPNTDEADNNDKINIKLTIKLKGTLKQRIKDLEFLIAMFKEKAFEMDGIVFSADFPQEELKKLNAESYPMLLEKYKLAQKVLEKLSVKKDVNIDDFTDEDFNKLSSLIEAVENGAPITNVTGELPRIVNYTFGGIRLTMLCKKVSDGSYKVADFFTENVDVCLKTDNGESLPVSQFSVLKVDDFLSVDNINYDNVVADFKKFTPHQFSVENINFVMLEMLKAYDQRKNDELLKAAKELTRWLLNQTEFLPKEISQINYLQIIRRERELTYQEKQELNNIVANTEDIGYKVGALILLNEFDEAKKLLKELPDERQKEFSEYPVYKFYKKNTEEQTK